MRELKKTRVLHLKIKVKNYKNAANTLGKISSSLFESTSHFDFFDIHIALKFKISNFSPGFDSLILVALKSSLSSINSSWRLAITCSNLTHITRFGNAVLDILILNLQSQVFRKISFI